MADKHISDEELEFYEGQTGSSNPNKGDQEGIYYRGESGLVKATPDVMKATLLQLGFADRHIHDMERSFLEHNGYSGALQDMRKQYFIDNS